MRESWAGLGWTTKTATATATVTDSAQSACQGVGGYEGGRAGRRVSL